MTNIDIVKCDDFGDLELPSYATPHSAAVDLRAAVEDYVSIDPGRRGLIYTGIKIAVPEGYAALVLPRSGLALKNGIGVANSPGLIDPDYRGEVGVILVNNGNHPFVVTRGMKIAQLMIVPFVRVQWNEAETLNQTKRGSGGLGSTGV